MRIVTALAAIVFTLVLLVISYLTSAGKPEFEAVIKDSVKAELTTVTSHTGEGDAKIEVKATFPPEKDYKVELNYRKSTETNYTSVPMIKQGNIYSAAIPHQDRGKKVLYYVSLTDPQGKRVTLPDGVDVVKRAYLLKFKGNVPAYILILHIIAMLGGLYYSIRVLFSSFSILNHKDALINLGKYVFRTTLLLFIGGVPLGILVNYFVFGIFWEAIPFGWDITDNKTQIILLYWILLLIFMRGTIFRKNKGMNLANEKVLAIMGICGFILTLGLYLIPHSL
jgi:hypothetical protein